jgi:hypothetical protein
LELEKKRGKGGEIRLGMKCESGDVIMFDDDDGEKKLYEIEKIEYSMKDIVKDDYMKENDVDDDSLGIVCG